MFEKPLLVVGPNRPDADGTPVFEDNFRIVPACIDRHAASSKRQQSTTGHVLEPVRRWQISVGRGIRHVQFAAVSHLPLLRPELHCNTQRTLRARRTSQPRTSQRWSLARAVVGAASRTVAVVFVVRAEQ